MENKALNSSSILFLNAIGFAFIACSISCAQLSEETYPVETTTTAAIGQYNVADTGQWACFNDSVIIPQPAEGQSFYGQDAQFTVNAPSYTDNEDGTITDNVTGLMWQQSYEAMSYEEAKRKVVTFNLANYTDWRIPTIKEAYSLMVFSGVDVSGSELSELPEGGKPFIDLRCFNFDYGSNGERMIDVQLLSSTVYRGKTMGEQSTVFGVNLADGRIKGYPILDPRSRSGKKFTVRFVRGNPEYGKNHFKDHADGTISDLATGLMWQQVDSQEPMSWKKALAWAEQKNSENHLNYGDWRLPNAKELQSIVDYSRSPQEDHSAAIDPLFGISQIEDEGGSTNYPFYWSSTTHENVLGGKGAVYVCFGEALGFFKTPLSFGKPTLQDVHGAGAQRSDPKTGSPDEFPYGYGPQGDVIRIYHYVRLVRTL